MDLDWYKLRNAQALGQMQLGLNLESLRQSPSAYIEGLKRAGVNPLLALGGLGSSAGSITLTPFGDDTSKSFIPSASHSARDYRDQDERELVKTQLRIAKADAELAESDTELTKLENSARMSALLGDHRSSPIGDEVEVMTHEGWKQLRDNVMEKLRKDGYSESEARARALDLMKAAETVTDVVGGSARAIRDSRRVSRGSNNFIRR